MDTFLEGLKSRKPNKTIVFIDFGLSWACLDPLAECPGRVLGLFCARLGPVLGPRRAVAGLLGTLLGLSGALGEPSRASLEVSWEMSDLS